MLLLPTFNAKLNPCPVSPAEFAPHPQGNFCGQCQRVVHDFSQSTSPRSDLAAARAAAPDGRVCGRFGAAQVQAAPRLSRRRRWFVAALVLVVAQGLTAREALAQVQRVGSHCPPIHHKKPLIPDGRKERLVTAPTIGIILEEIPMSPSDTTTLRTYAEVMPTLQGRDYKEIVAYIQQHVRWPKGATTDAEGRVFVRFTVGKDGLVRGAEVLKGIHSLCNSEAMRIVQALPAFTPGQQKGKPVPVSLTVPITFRRH